MRKFSAHTEPWGNFLDVKICQTPLHPAQLFRRSVLLSSVTDPYNIFEKKYEVTRKILLQLIPAQPRLSVITKSALVVRDIDLLQQIPACEVAFSFSTADETLRRLLEPYASSVEEKTDALRRLHEAGIRTAVMAAPLLPELSNWQEIIEKTAPFTDVYRFDGLNMHGPLRTRRIMDFIDVHYPHLLPLYARIYVEGDGSYFRQLAAQIRAYCAARARRAEIFFG